MISSLVILLCSVAVGNSGTVGPENTALPLFRGRTTAYSKAVLGPWQLLASLTELCVTPTYYDLKENMFERSLVTPEERATLIRLSDMVHRVEEWPVERIARIVDVLRRCDNPVLNWHVGIDGTGTTNLARLGMRRVPTELIDVLRTNLSFALVAIYRTGVGGFPWIEREGVLTMRMPTFEKMGPTASAVDWRLVWRDIIESKRPRRSIGGIILEN